MSQRKVNVDELAARMEAKFKKKKPVVKKVEPSLAPPGWRKALAETQHADPRTLVDEQLVLAQWMQNSFKEHIRQLLTGSQPKGITLADVKAFEVMTSCLATAIRTLEKVDAVADEMSRRLTGEQLLEAALVKIESHEPQTIRWAIKRLKARLELTTTKSAPLVTATDALADLAEDE
jgi:hypothetical protein